MRIETKAVRGSKGGDPHTGVVSFPIYQSATFKHPGLNWSTGYDYSRDQNPTREEMERTMAILEGGKRCLAFSTGLAGHEGRDIHFAQAEGAGAVLSFQTRDVDTARRFMKKVRLAAVAVSLGGVETIVSYPAKMSHAAMPAREREKLGISENLIRVSLGLEDVDDLIADFAAALPTQP